MHAVDAAISPEIKHHNMTPKVVKGERPVSIEPDKVFWKILCLRVHDPRHAAEHSDLF
jgi:hypothetical protein